MSEAWVCKTSQQFDVFCSHIKNHWDWNIPLSVTWDKGIKKSMGQRALVHIWFREISKHLNRLPGKDGSYTEHDIKDYCKKRWGVRKDFTDPLTGESMQKLKSTEDYLKGEMTEFMNRVEVFAADINCLLPVWGEYAELRAAA